MFRTRVCLLSDLATPRLQAIAAAADTDVRRGFMGKRPHLVLADCERRWRAVAGIDRLDLTISTTGVALSIHDTRLVRSVITHIPTVAKDIDEPALSLITARLYLHLPTAVVPRGKCVWWVRSLAAIGFHCLGRHFERSNLGDDGLLNNLLQLATAHPALSKTQGDFRLPVSNGEWRGYSCPLVEPNGATNPTINPRTFVVPGVWDED